MNYHIIICLSNLIFFIVYLDPKPNTKLKIKNLFIFLNKKKKPYLTIKIIKIIIYLNYNNNFY